MEHKSSPAARYGAFALALVMAALPATFELGAAWPIPGRYYLGYFGLGVGLLWLWGDLRWSSTVKRPALLLAAALATLHLVPWSSRKAFLTRFFSIESGMTVQAVDALLQPYVFTESQPSEHDTERAYRHEPVGHYDSDVGVVRFRDGLVAETRFTPD